MQIFWKCVNMFVFFVLVFFVFFLQKRKIHYKKINKRGVFSQRCQQSSTGTQKKSTLTPITVESNYEPALNSWTK